MNYEEHIQEIKDITFDKIIELNKRLAPQYRGNENLYHSLEHGTAILKTEEQLLAYLSNYGKMHQAKINEVLPQINLSEISSSDIQILDWGCGQGLATICLLDFFQEHSVPYELIKKIVLIEPSLLALERAFTHVNAYIRDSERITKINKLLNDVSEQDIVSSQPITIHLFSNILDIPNIDLLQLANKIKNGLSGKHFFLCMGPLNYGNNRIDTFWSYFNEATNIYSDSHSKQAYSVTGQVVKEYNYTAKNRLFKIDGDICELLYVEYYSPKQFHASYQLDAVRASLEKNVDKEKLEGLHKTLSDFEIQTPFDIGASIYDDVHPIFAVLNNIIVRGLPTKASPIIEEAFSSFGNIKVEDDLGSINYSIEGLNHNDLFSAMHLIDHRWIITPDNYNCDILDSDLEKHFITQTPSQIISQLMQPQRDLSTITEKQWHHSQRVDFAFQFPYPTKDNYGFDRTGCTIELDGNRYHSNAPQIMSDQQRVNELVASKWYCIRLKENEINKAIDELHFLGSEYVQKVQEVYQRPFDKSWTDTLQLVLSPIAVSRVEKTILEALMTGRLNIHDKKWKILVKEHDVPCAALAFEDLKEMFDNLTQMSVDYSNMKFPEVELTIISTKEFAESKLHRGKKPFVGEYHSNTEYDLVIDFAMLRRAGLEKIDFTEYRCKNKCYFVVRSAHYHRNERQIYTSDKIKYKPLAITDTQGRYIDIPENVGILSYYLHLLFRKKEFRPGQTPILNRALQNKSVIGLLPTGGGKSLTYQIAAMLQPGVTLVIDPLRSLMKDQYDGLKKNGIDFCTYINSAIEPPSYLVEQKDIDRYRAEERERRARQMEKSELLYVFLSPERLAIKSFRDRLQNMHDTGVYFSYGVIDEVHCVSEWGHDFRFTYLHLGRNLYQYVLPKQIEEKNCHIPLFGLTATASFDVLADVERELSGNGAFPLDSETIVRNGNTNRFELQYKIEPIPIAFHEKNGLIQLNKAKWEIYDAKNETLDNLISRMPEYLNELLTIDSISKIKEGYEEGAARADKGISTVDLQVSVPNDFLVNSNTYTYGGIVFCPHRNKTGIAVYTNEKAILSKHPNTMIGTFVGSNSDIRDEELSDDEDKKSFTNLDLFRDNKIPLMIATKAFGMGIDKPNVRFTINMNYSSSLESFVQEAGRAGRDRKMALSIIMLSKYKIARVHPESVYYKNEKNKWYDGSNIDELAQLKHIPISEFEVCDETSDLVKLKCKQCGDKCYRFEKDCCSYGCSYQECKNRKPECSQACDKEKGCSLSNVASEYRWGFYEHLKTLKEKYDFLTLENYEYLNADYETVMFFYNQNFKGENIEKQYMFQLLSKKKMGISIDDDSTKQTINGFLTSLQSVKVGDEVISYISYHNDEYADIAKAIYRMCCIELIDDFTQDYNTKKFRIVTRKKEEGEYYNALERYLRRYYSEERAHELIEVVPSYKGENEIHKCLGFLTHFIYDKIAVKRKRAIDDIRAFCIRGINNNSDWKQINEDLKDELYFYFNSKYARKEYKTESGLDYSLTYDTDEGKNSTTDILFKYMDVVNDEWIRNNSEIGSTQIDNAKHLYGAVRLIRSHLTDDNPTIFLLGAFCLMFLGTNKNPALEDELATMYLDGMVGFYQRETDSDFWEDVFNKFNQNQYVETYLKNNNIPFMSATILKIHQLELKKITNKYTA